MGSILSNRCHRQQHCRVPFRTLRPDISKLLGSWHVPCPEMTPKKCPKA